ncbi:MAG: tRNA (adenosine(37)-N6)-dimethylallyltransferase MiaA [Prevotellaceae bacterium]|nr:tRNA (adenosine(37)-N6)-dimethylallyltransferase MiaA [Prevotellaceae bacterium]
MERKTLFVVVGPTAVGKTELALRLAERFGTEIVGADSRQIYRDLPIGTAAPSAAERRRVQHHLVGTLALTDYYSAACYERDALAAIAAIHARSSAAVLTGGSMLYVDAVCRGIDDIPTVRDEVRLEMKRRLEHEGLEALAAELLRLDPGYYARCDTHNPKRVVHALEICRQTGRTYTSFRRAAVKERPFCIVKIGLDRPRAELFGRINRRTSEMVEHGWLDEARRVLPFRSENALNTVGYKELFRHFDGEWTLDFALERIRKNTRVYAKKQLLWFRKDASVRWFHPDETEAVLGYAEACLRE